MQNDACNIVVMIFTTIDPKEPYLGYMMKDDTIENEVVIKDVLLVYLSQSLDKVEVKNVSRPPCIARIPSKGQYACKIDSRPSLDQPAPRNDNTKGFIRYGPKHIPKRKRIVFK